MKGTAGNYIQLEVKIMISTKGRYALRVMIDMAERHTDNYIPLRDIAENQQISEKYLEAIIKILVRARLVRGLRGKGGGYKLTREPKDYYWRDS